MAERLHRAGRIVLLVAVFMNCGAHWLVLQSLAWTTMLVENSRQSSFVAAMQVTFDGAHPCDICKTVQNGRNTEKKQESPTLVMKVDALYEPVSIVLHPPHLSRDTERESRFAEARFCRPAFPPPRGC